jgi:hypothetical protein
MEAGDVWAVCQARGARRHAHAHARFTPERGGGRTRTVSHTALGALRARLPCGALTRAARAWHALGRAQVPNCANPERAPSVRAHARCRSVPACTPFASPLASPHGPTRRARVAPRGARAARRARGAGVAPPGGATRRAAAARRRRTTDTCALLRSAAFSRSPPLPAAARAPLARLRRAPARRGGHPPRRRGGAPLPGAPRPHHARTHHTPCRTLTCPTRSLPHHPPCMHAAPPLTRLCPRHRRRRRRAPFVRPRHGHRSA